ncbi:MAG TPA: fibronectin type III domain-containing protein [Thermoanaerobaculia bacterium]
MSKDPVKYCLLAIVFFFFLQIEAFATNAPSGLIATGASSSQVNLAWTDNSSDETGFTFAFDTNSGLTNPTYVYAGGVSTTSYSHTGRSAATTYYYKIKAEGNPDSAWTSIVGATTSPSGLAVTSTSSSTISLGWTGNGSNTSIVGYTVAYATNSSFSGAVYKFVSGAGATSYTITGLYSGTTYYCKVKAEGTSNSYDSPFTSSITAATTGAAPNAPSGLSATAASSSQINLSWTDNSSNETGFEIKRATDSGFTQNVVWIGGIQGTSYSNTGLSPSTTYYYKVRAEGVTQDSAYSAAVSATTSASGSTVPNPPSGLNATAASSTQVNLSWTDNSSNETGFEIKRATDSGFTQNVVWIGGIQGTSYSNAGLSPSTTYYYKVRAEGTAGKSAYSSTASVTTDSSSSGTISPLFFGINAWMPYQIGAHKYYGKLETKWADIQASGVRIMRYGGNGVDHHADPTWVDPNDSTKSTLGQYLTLVDTMRSYGIEPVLQVPVYGSAYSASQAADIVRYINVTHGRAVKYWVIGNEPDLDSGAYNYTTAAQIAGYIKPFASAMKAVDPSIKIIGPETTWYDTSLIYDLTRCDNSADDITGADGNGNYYVDIISFHLYNGFSGTQTRSQVITKLMSAGGLNDDLIDLKDRLDGCNGRTGEDALQIAITEANVNYQNPSGDSLTGVGAKSFLGGQFWAEILGIAMQHGVAFVNFWSAIEGNELGYISGDGTIKRPAYEHFKMVAQNFRGDWVAAADNNQANVKTFAAKDTDQIAVMIMNQDQSSSFNYTVRLNTGAVSGVNPLKINVDAGVAVEYSGTIATESSIVLVFDAAGNIKKKIEYKLNGHASSGLPPSVTNY